MNTSTFGTRTSSEGNTKRGSRIAHAIKRRSAMVPSNLFVWAAGASILASVAVQVLGMRRRRHLWRSSSIIGSSSLGTFVGEWAPTLLLMGLYKKLAKVTGEGRPNDRIERDREE